VTQTSHGATIHNPSFRKLRSSDAESSLFYPDGGCVCSKLERTHLYRKLKQLGIKTK
jgi:hypothetical protein